MGGYQMLVRGEVMRGKFRESFEKPVPFTPERLRRLSLRCQMLPIPSGKATG